jgi:serine/threonine protein kinase
VEPLKSNDPSVLGDWRVMGRLGQGGFGTVFLAEKGAQKAAIKVIKSEFLEESDARARLVLEAEVLSKLSNPFIGKILDSDLNGELPWIATEFINGPTLDNKVKYEGPLDEIEWFNLAANLFHAIVAANELGVIHKDIKPSNIILGETGNKLIDFGIAHIEGRTKTVVFGDREGSTPFSSPEHFTPRSNPKMDVFSAAATLAFAAKGSGVWAGENDLQLMRSINDDEPDLSNLTQNQVEFLLPLFEKNPSDRPSAVQAQDSALEYIEYFLGNKKPSLIQVKGGRKKRKQTERKKLSKYTTFLDRYRKLVYVVGGISVVGLIFLFTDIFGVFFWSVIFLLFPVLPIWFTQKTYRRGIGRLRWGKRNILKTSVVFIASTLLPVLILLASLFSAATIPMNMSLFVNNLLTQDSGNSSVRIDESLRVKTVVSIQTRELNEAANNFFYKKDFKKSLENAEKSANLGNAEGMFLAGRAANSLGNTELALKWYLDASKNNFSQASLAAGQLHLKDKDFDLAISEFEHAIKLGNLEASTELGIYYLSAGKNDEATKLLEDSIQKGDVTAMVNYAYFLKETGKTKEAITYFKAASDAGDSIGSLFIGYLYSTDVKKRNLTKKYYELSYQRGLVEASWFLGEFLKNSGEFKAAESAYLRSSASYPQSAISISSLYAINLDDIVSACSWAERVKQIEGVEETELKEGRALESLYCKDKIKTSQSSPTPSSVKSAGVSSSPKPKSTTSVTKNPLPILSSESFKASAPIASNLESDEIFGRAFIDGMNYWRIPLTNSKSEKVPALNAIQFRMIGFENAGWMDVPYKLKTDSVFGTVYAEVDDMMFAVIFKNVKYCPEFRVAREEGGKIVRIWEKGKPECATDYNP